MLLGQMIFLKDPLAFHLANSYLAFKYHYECPPLGVVGGFSPRPPQEVKRGIVCVPTAHLASAIPISHVVCVLPTPS